jgi:hypothetical protein
MYRRPPVSARAPLGQLLVQAGLVSTEALEGVLQDQPGDGRRLGEILVARGLVTAAQLTQILSHQLALPWVSLAKVTVDASLLALVPRAVAERHHIVPVYLRREDSRSLLYVATDDPTDQVALRACSDGARMDVRPMVAASDDLRAAIDAWYGDGPRAPPGPAPPGRPSVGAMRAAVSVELMARAERPAAPVAKPTKLPVPAPAQIEEVELAEEDVVPHVSAPPAPTLEPVVLVVAAPKTLVRTCRTAAAALQVRVKASDFASASGFVRELSPFAIVVTEDVYAFDRLGISKLALEADALLVIWSDDLEAEYLEPLLDTAHKHRLKR